jgi:hypothetical protein
MKIVQYVVVVATKEGTTRIMKSYDELPGRIVEGMWFPAKKSF